MGTEGVGDPTEVSSLTLGASAVLELVSARRELCSYYWLRRRVSGVTEPPGRNLDRVSRSLYSDILLKNSVST